MCITVYTALVLLSLTKTKYCMLHSIGIANLEFQGRKHKTDINADMNINTILHIMLNLKFVRLFKVHTFV